MKKALTGMFTSKKFIASLAAAICSGVGTLGLNLPTESVVAILSPIIAYVLGQGIADTGKEKAKVEKEG